MIPFQTTENFEGKMQNKVYSSDFYGGENFDNKRFQNFNSFYFSIDSLKSSNFNFFDNIDPLPTTFLEIQSNLTLNSQKYQGIGLVLSEHYRNELKSFIILENFLKETMGEIYENNFLVVAKEKLKFNLENILIFMSNLEKEEERQRNLDIELKLLLQNKNAEKSQKYSLNHLEEISKNFLIQIKETDKYFN